MWLIVLLGVLFLGKPTDAGEWRCVLECRKVARRCTFARKSVPRRRFVDILLCSWHVLSSLGKMHCLCGEKWNIWVEVVFVALLLWLMAGDAPGIPGSESAEMGAESSR